MLIAVLAAPPRCAVCTAPDPEVMFWRPELGAAVCGSCDELLDQPGLPEGNRAHPAPPRTSPTTGQEGPL